jgi:hypothetical protein
MVTMSPDAPSLSLAADDPSRVASDVPCMACGYNLRTLSARAACPECGEFVWMTLAQVTARHAASAWLRSVASGVRILVIATAVLTLAGLTSIYWPLALPGPAGSRWTLFLLMGEWDPLSAATYLIIAALLLRIVGLNRLCAGDPHGRADFPFRLDAFELVILAAALLGRAMIATAGGGDGWFWPIAGTAVLFCAAACELLSLIVFHVHLHYVGEALAAPGVRRMAWAATAAHGLSFVLFVTLGTIPGTPPLGPAAAVVGSAALVATLVMVERACTGELRRRSLD